MTGRQSDGVVLACDLGGSSFKACLIEASGRMVAQTSLASPPTDDRDGASEIDPSAWWSALLEACARLAAQAPHAFATLEAVAICGLTRSQVLIGADGNSLRPAFTWKDSRATETAERLADRVAAEHPERRQLNAYHPLARLVWMKENEPAIFNRLAHVLEPKDYLNFRLTGRRASDPISMARLLACKQVDGIDSLLSAAGVPDHVLPPLLDPCDKVGTIIDGLPPPFDGLRGLPVFCCSNDTWAGVVGLGALRQGMAYNISGTTEVFGVMSREPSWAEGLLTVDWGAISQLGGPSLSGADSVPWLLSLLGRDDQAVADAVAGLLAHPRQPQPLLFLPYLQGERVPHWDPSLRGSFIGLGRQHGPVDLLWAVMEGVAFLNREVLARAESAHGWPVSCIRFGGGAALNAAWCQIKADICGRPVEVCAASEPGVLGAAAVAWTGLGRFASLTEAQDQLVRVKHRYEPDPTKTESYSTLFGLFQRSGEALAPISRALTGFAEQNR